MKTAVALLLLLPALPAAAGRTDKGNLLGWTPDGLTVLYIDPPEDVGLGDFGGTGSVTYGVARDGRSGMVTQRYVLSMSGEIPPEDKKTLKALPHKDAWQALVAKSPPACAPPDGATAEVQAKGKDVKVTRKKDGFEFEFTGDDMAEEKKALLTLSVTRAGKTSPSLAWTAVQGDGVQGASLSGGVHACFAPGGRRVAWVLVRNSGMMRDTGEWTVLVGPTAGPRIQLVADKAILHEAAARVGAALDAAGLTPTSSKASNDATPRAASVVYAAAGFESDAQKVAAAVPGGATVTKLDWKAPFEIIVGIGATAMK